MTLITLDEIAAHHPDVLLPPDPEFMDATVNDAGELVVRTEWREHPAPLRWEAMT